MKAAMMDEAATVNFPGTRVVSDTENDHMNSKYYCTPHGRRALVCDVEICN